MTIHVCLKCDYKTTSTTSLKKHMNRKNPCDVLKIPSAKTRQVGGIPPPKPANAFDVSKKLITCKKNTNV